MTEKHDQQWWDDFFKQVPHTVKLIKEKEEAERQILKLAKERKKRADTLLSAERYRTEVDAKLSDPSNYSKGTCYDKPCFVTKCRTKWGSDDETPCDVFEYLAREKGLETKTFNYEYESRIWMWKDEWPSVPE